MNIVFGNCLMEGNGYSMVCSFALLDESLGLYLTMVLFLKASNETFLDVHLRDFDGIEFPEVPQLAKAIS